MNSENGDDKRGCGCREAATDRRAFLKAGVGLGVGLAVGAEPALAQNEAARERPKEGDVLVRDGGNDLRPLTPDDIKVGAQQIMAWAMDPASNLVRNGTRFNRVLLMRFDAAELQGTTKERAADGVVAYTAICTHAGCEVIDWLADERVMHCPCHFSKYDPKNGAQVVGGDAPRPLPALPLKVVDGKLVVAKPFTARVGFLPA